MSYSFDSLRSGYTPLWTNMVVSPDKHGTVDAIARKLLRHKDQYQAVSAKTGVPWYVIAGLHNRESDADFTTYLGNGEKLTHVTRLVPRGRGPFPSWEAGAIDALHLDGLDRVTDWSPERICYEVEKFNGFGYRGHSINSPYLWSFSNQYTRGKYVADGEFSSSRVDPQCGAIPVIKRLIELDGTVVAPVPMPPPAQKPAPAPKPPAPPKRPPVTKPVIVTGAGGLLGSIAAYFGASPAVVIGVFIVTVIVGGIVVYHLTKHRDD